MRDPSSFIAYSKELQTVGFGMIEDRAQTHTHTRPQIDPGYLDGRMFDWAVKSGVLPRMLDLFEVLRIFLSHSLSLSASRRWCLLSANLHMATPHDYWELSKSGILSAAWAEDERDEITRPQSPGAKQRWQFLSIIVLLLAVCQEKQTLK